MRLKKGYVKVAGLFFSMKKCPNQAKLYPARSAKRKLRGFRVKTSLNKKNIEKHVPIK